MLKVVLQWHNKGGKKVIFNLRRSVVRSIHSYNTIQKDQQTNKWRHKKPCSVLTWGWTFYQKLQSRCVKIIGQINRAIGNSKQVLFWEIHLVRTLNFRSPFCGWLWFCENVTTNIIKGTQSALGPHRPGH